MITPILKDPKEHGGTLYTFPSASRDLTRAFSNSEYEFAFSHFACLNLPDFRYGSFKDDEKNLKGIYLDALYPNCIDNSKDINNCLKWHLQSYVMNYEIAILNGFSLDSGVYDNDILTNPSERIFFNWLQKVNGIKFNGTTETLEGYSYDTNMEFNSLLGEYQLDDKDKTKSYRIGNKLYTWKGGKWRSRFLVSKTVQYIGTIDMINNVNIDSDSFNEIYLNIPAGVGGSTSVKFNNVFDKNYQKGEIIDVDEDKYCKDVKYIIGRNPEDLNMSEDKTLEAIYDSNSNHTYNIETGYCIDFNDSQYADNSGKSGIEAMNLGSEEDFEFNCVLIYYRIKKGGKWFTNLYGVLFLEEVTESDYNTDLNDDDEIGGYIQRYPKFKKGNSWGLKLDLKIDAQPDSQLELRDRQYADPNDGGVSMQMFTEALIKLNDCSKLFYEVKKENTDIEERIYTLENIMSGVDNVYNLSNDVSLLRARLEMMQPSIDSLQGRISDVENKLVNLENKLGNFINMLNETIGLGQYKIIIGDVE
jgi:hypothetical protein